MNERKSIFINDDLSKNEIKKHLIGVICVKMEDFLVENKWFDKWGPHKTLFEAKYQIIIFDKYYIW